MSIDSCNTNMYIKHSKDAFIKYQKERHHKNKLAKIAKKKFLGISISEFSNSTGVRVGYSSCAVGSFTETGFLGTCVGTVHILFSRIKREMNYDLKTNCLTLYYRDNSEKIVIKFNEASDMLDVFSFLQSKVDELHTPSTVESEESRGGSNSDVVWFPFSDAQDI